MKGSNNVEIATIIFLALTIIISSVKLFFVLTFIYVTWLILTKGFGKAIIFSGISLNMFLVGQYHKFLVIPKSAIVSQQYLEGRHLNLIVTPYFLISIAGFLIFFFWYKNYEKLSLNLTEKLFLIITGWGILSALYGALMPSFSIYQTIFPFITAFWLFYLITFSENISFSQWQKMVRTINNLLMISILFEAGIALLQFYFKGPIGLSTEINQIAPVFGLGADESSSSFRPFGFQFHPNGLANHQLILLFSLLVTNTYLKSKKILYKNIFQFVVLASILTIAISLSRAGFIALLITFFIIWWQQPKLVKKIFASIKKFFQSLKSWHKLVLITCSFFIIFIVNTRLLNTIYSFNDEGGVNTRVEQYSEAIQVLKHSPIWGIGEDMFIPTSFQLFPNGVMTFFPENVHNGFLLITIERGLVGMTLYLLFWYLIAKNTQTSALNNKSKTMIYSGLVGLLIMMVFHPEKNFINIFILITLSLLHFEQKNIK